MEFSPSIFSVDVAGISTPFLVQTKSGAGYPPVELHTNVLSWFSSRSDVSAAAITGTPGGSKEFNITLIKIVKAESCLNCLQIF